VNEGERYRVGGFKFEGQTVVKEEALRPLFKLKKDDWYAEKRIRKGLEKSREIFGAGGYFEFTGYPDLQPHEGAVSKGAPVVDVTMRMQPGKQYFVNRIIFAGNTTTRDNVIRREIRVYEAGVFNTEALKFSIKRLNQLGYFKPLEGEAINVEKTPGQDSKVDVTLKFEEQNRNQLTFGAGVSQFEGFFGQLSFQTANFLGRGETFTLSAQQGDRAKNYQVAFTEPFLFDRPITAGVDTYIRTIRYIGLFTQASSGGNFVFGYPLHDFTRMFLNYSYEKTRVKDLYEGYLDPEVQARNPYLADSLLLGSGGRRTVSKITPSIVYNTVDNPIFPSAGRRFTTSFDVAGVGGDTYFISPTMEGVLYIPQTRRLSIGLRGQVQYIRPYGSTKTLPIFERLFLGGEYSIRGFDIRTIGPRDPETLVVTGGNKSLLFNAEYLISVAGPVRLVLFYDAGQVQDSAQRFAFDDFRTSTGAEIRFFMPVLNVPFRLIMAYNPQRAGVYDNNFLPQKKFSFRFAVGSTF
jgi:outer membrane protein insertion porin family